MAAGRKIELPDGRQADFALRLDSDEGEPYIARGSTVYVQIAPPGDGDVGLFLYDGRIILRQYCADWAGNIHLLCLNRARSREDIVVTGDRRLLYFGRLSLNWRPPLPEF